MFSNKFGTLRSTFAIFAPHIEKFMRNGYIAALIVGSILYTATIQSLCAQETSSDKKVKFVYNAVFDFNFDNREFDPGKEELASSGTIFGARLTPSAGIEIKSGSSTHRLMAGIDVMKDFGRSPVLRDGAPDNDIHLENSRLLREVTMYYSVTSTIGNWQLRGFAGILPRYLTTGDYSKAFFSDSLVFYDNNLEGALIQATGKSTAIEVVFDWNGKYGIGRREQFSAFGHLTHSFARIMQGGLYAKYHHYANTATYGSVVGDAPLMPLVQENFGTMAGIQELSAKIALYCGLQNDRRDKENGNKGRTGTELTLKAMKWNIGIDNTLYIGQGLMPLYSRIDDGGYRYGNSLYTGSPMYRLDASDEASRKWKTYNRLEVFYQPHIADFIDLRLSVIAHFPGSFAGTQQQLSLLFNLDRLIGR